MGQRAPFAAPAINAAIPLFRSTCCARAAKDQTAAAPPTGVIRLRQFMNASEAEHTLAHLPHQGVCVAAYADRQRPRMGWTGRDLAPRSFRWGFEDMGSALRGRSSLS